MAKMEHGGAGAKKLIGSVAGAAAENFENPGAACGARTKKNLLPDNSEH